MPTLDKEITELDALTNPAMADLLVMVENSSNITKKITYADLFSAMPFGSEWIDDNTFLVLEDVAYPINIGSPYTLHIPTFLPSVDPFFNVKALFAENVLGAVGIDAETPQLVLFNFDSVNEIINSANFGMHVNGPYDFVPYFNYNLALADPTNDPVPYYNLGIGSLFVGNNEAVQTITTSSFFDGTDEYFGFEPFMVISKDGGNASIMFVTEVSPLHGAYLDYSPMTGCFQILGDNQGVLTGVIVPQPDHINIVESLTQGGLGVNETDDIGRLRFTHNVPGFILGSLTDSAYIDSKLTFVGASYPDDVDSSAQLDFYSKPLGGIPVIGLTITDEQDILIYNDLTMQQFAGGGNRAVMVDNDGKLYV